MRLGAAALAALLATGPVEAAETLGWSLAISNDSIGQFKDRWQSSSVQLGIVRGDAWQGRAPERVGELLEFRFRTDLITPEELDDPDPDDRRHAGVLAFGLHTHFERGGYEARLGADLVVVGEQTGLLSLQEELHNILGFTVPELDDFQIDDQERLDVSGEIARSFDLGTAVVRPFAEAQVGSEDLLRIGLDVTWGALARDTLLLRALTTGQRVPAITAGQGLSWSVGADIAFVEDSIYLPENLGYDLTDTRQRVRGGAHYRLGRYDVFYGVAWLSEEFEAQPEGQFVGTFQARMDF